MKNREIDDLKAERMDIIVPLIVLGIIMLTLVGATIIAIIHGDWIGAGFGVAFMVLDTTCLTIGLVNCVNITKKIQLLEMQEIMCDIQEFFNEKVQELDRKYRNYFVDDNHIDKN